MTQEITTNMHVDSINSDPHLVRRNGQIVVCVILSIDGHHVAVTLGRHTANVLGHALSVDPLPLIPGYVGPGGYQDEH